MEVHIEFLELGIEGDDHIEIHKSWKKSGASGWTIDNKYHALIVEGYGGERFLLMEFESKKPDSSRKKSKGFRGVFKVTGGEGKIQIALARSLFVSPSGVEGEQAKEPGIEKCFVTRTARTHVSDVIVSDAFLQ